MSTAPTPEYPNPLGLPAGSVRGILALMICVLFWMLLVLPDENAVPIPLNLYFLLGLVGMFMLSYGGSIAGADDPEPSPWHLPAWFFPVIIIGGTAAVLGLEYANHRERLMTRLTPTAEQIKAWPYYLFSLIGGFVLGYLIRHLPGRRTAGFQAIQAWVSMLAMLALLAEIIIRTFIVPSLEDKIDMVTWQCIITVVVTCYFATRS